MAQYDPQDLRDILKSDFLYNPHAFGPGRTNDDMVDSMCICFALGEDWDEFFKKFVATHTVVSHGEEFLTGTWHCYRLNRFTENGKDIPYWYQRKDSDISRIREHADRVAAWLEDKEEYGGYERGSSEIMYYSINY